MRIPNAKHAQVDREKIERYLLCHDHPDGASKARFFEQFGFDRANWRKLAAALQEHAQTQPVAKTVVTAYGTRYIVDGRMSGLDGRQPPIRTVWIIEEGVDQPRLVTAYPCG